MTFKTLLIFILTASLCIGQTIGELKKELSARGYGKNHPVFKMLEEGKDVSKYLKPEKITNLDFKPDKFLRLIITKRVKNDRYTPIVFDLREEVLNVIIKFKLLEGITNIEFIADSKIVIKIKSIKSEKLVNLVFKDYKLDCSLLSDREYLKSKRVSMPKRAINKKAKETSN